MKISALTSFSFLFLLSTVAAAQGTRPPGTTGSAGTPPATTGTSGTTTPRPAVVHSSPTAPIDTADYRLVTGDQLRIEVYKDQQLSQSLQIRPDGKITLPLVGDLQASGSTPLELRDRLTEALREYVTNPVVTVIVVEAVPPLVYVIGEVGNAGSIPMHGPMSVLQALAMAGGFRDFANTKKIQILRRTSRGQQRIAFNYKEALAATGPPMMLQPGDTVVVP